MIQEQGIILKVLASYSLAFNENRFFSSASKSDHFKFGIKKKVQSFFPCQVFMDEI